MHYQYHCGCCNKVVSSHDKECHHCGSHNIKTPYGLWLFCIFACLTAAIIFKVAHLYLQDHQNVPVQQGILSTLQDVHHKSNSD